MTDQPRYYSKGNYRDGYRILDRHGWGDGIVRPEGLKIAYVKDCSDAIKIVNRLNLPAPTAKPRSLSYTTEADVAEGASILATIDALLDRSIDFVPVVDEVDIKVRRAEAAPAAVRFTVRLDATGREVA